MAEIIVTQDGNIAIVTISRPGKLNSVTWEMLEEFDNVVESLFKNQEVLGIIFTGDGEKAFSAGFDLDMVKGLKGEDHYNFFKLLERVTTRFQNNHRCITLAACNGYAIGFGAILAVSCDFRFFSENAMFSLPELLINVFPGAGASSNLIPLVGPSRAKDILMTGRKVLAEEAFHIGLADRVLNLGELMNVSTQFMKDITSQNKIILQNIKSLLDEITDVSESTAAEIESDYFEKWLQDSRNK